MTKRIDEQSPKIWPDMPGRHFNPYYEKEKAERRAHERGQELKILHAMGERQRQHPIIREHPSPNSHAPVTLPTVKWIKP